VSRVLILLGAGAASLQVSLYLQHFGPGELVVKIRRNKLVDAMAIHRQNTPENNH